MKKIIIIFLFLAGIANAAPYLTCNPDPNCEYYKVIADGQEIADRVPAPLWFDLKDMTPGTISFEAECCNYWGCKKTENPYISKDKPLSPTNLRMEPSQ